MKSPEEIKKGAACCFHAGDCKECPYVEGTCTEFVTNHELVNDMASRIEQLEEQISLMKLQMKGDCGCCKHRNDERKLDDKQFGCRLSPVCYECLKKDGRNMWEYEGLPEVKNKLEVTRK